MEGSFLVGAWEGDAGHGTGTRTNTAGTPLRRTVGTLLLDGQDETSGSEALCQGKTQALDLERREHLKHRRQLREQLGRQWAARKTAQSDDGVGRIVFSEYGRLGVRYKRLHARRWKTSRGKTF